MRTKFDHISDGEIERALRDPRALLPYDQLPECDLLKIASLSLTMERWQSWAGFPATQFSMNDLDFDGHHRSRAVMFLARRRGIQIVIPFRFSTTMGE